jgi:integrase
MRKTKSRAAYGQGSLYQRGHVWWMQYRLDGKTIRRSTGTTKRSEAVIELQRVLGQKHRGELPEQVKAKRGLTCGEVMEQYVERRSGKAVYRTYRGQLDNHLIPFFGKIPIRKLTGNDIVAYRNMRRKQRVASNAHTLKPDTKPVEMDFVTETSINRELAVLRGALREQEKLDPTSITKIPHFTMESEKENVRHGFFNESVLESLLDKMPVYLRCLLACAFHCGGRMSEWLRLDWEDIDLENRTIYFRKTKTKYPREVPIWRGTAMERLILAQHQGRELTSTNAVFTADGIHRLRVFRKSWSKAVAAAGFPELRFHDTRRSANKWMRDKGVPQPVRMYIMGHRTSSMDVRYGIVDKVSLDSARAAVEGPAQKDVNVK